MVFLKFSHIDQLLWTSFQLRGVNIFSAIKSIRDWLQRLSLELSSVRPIPTLQVSMLVCFYIVLEGKVFRQHLKLMFFSLKIFQWFADWNVEGLWVFTHATGTNNQDGPCTGNDKYITTIAGKMPSTIKHPTFRNSNLWKDVHLPIMKYSHYVFILTGILKG